MKGLEKYQLIVAALIIAISLYMFGGNRGVKPEKVIVRDTVVIDNKALIDSLSIEVANLNEQLAQAVSGVSEREQAAIARLEQIRYYVKITKQRPQNKEFLIPWIERALR